MFCLTGNNGEKFTLSSSRQVFRVFFLIYLVTLLSVSATAETTIAWVGDWRGKSGDLTESEMHKLVPVFTELRRTSPDLILLSCGSMLGPSIVSENDKGQLVLSLMNQSHFDAMGIGPHDFFAGAKNLLERAEEASFPFLCTNIQIDRDQPTGNENWDIIKPMTMISRSEKSILVLAVICPKTSLDWPNWDPAISFQDPITALEKFEGKGEEADMVVLLSNMSFSDNLRTLNKLKWIDVIMTNPISDQIEEAHDFTRFDFGLNDGRRICWSLPNNEPGYGLLKDIVDNGQPWLIATPHRINTDTPEDEKILREVKAAENKVITAAGKAICQLSNAELKDITGAFLKILRSKLNAEVAVIQDSAIQDEKVGQNPTSLDIQSSFPFPDRVALMQVSGKVLHEIWNKNENRSEDGQGFRTIGLSKHKNILLVNGRPVRESDSYRLATTEYLAKGGFNLISADSKAIRTEKYTDLLIGELGKTTAEQRAASADKSDKKAVLRQKLSLSASYDQLEFSNSANEYQYKDSKAAYTSSDIPGLVGSKHLKRAFNFDYEAALDKPYSDSILRITSSFAKMEATKLSDKWQVLARHTKKSLEADLLPFFELQLTGAHLKPDNGKRDRPLFGKSVIGMTWKYSDQNHFFLGLGHLRRFSVDDKPGNTGLNFGFELVKKLSPELNLSSNFDSFMTNDSDKIRTFDGNIQLKAKIYKQFSIIISETIFGWKDSSVGKMGTRNETFSGIGYDFSLRHFE